MSREQTDDTVDLRDLAHLIKAEWVSALLAAAAFFSIIVVCLWGLTPIKYRTETAISFDFSPVCESLKESSVEVCDDIAVRSLTRATDSVASPRGVAALQATAGLFDDSFFAPRIEGDSPETAAIKALDRGMKFDIVGSRIELSFDHPEKSRSEAITAQIAQFVSEAVYAQMKSEIERTRLLSEKKLAALGLSNLDGADVNAMLKDGREVSGVAALDLIETLQLLTQNSDAIDEARKQPILVGAARNISLRQNPIALGVAGVLAAIFALFFVQIRGVLRGTLFTPAAIYAATGKAAFLTLPVAGIKSVAGAELWQEVRLIGQRQTPKAPRRYALAALAHGGLLAQAAKGFGREMQMVRGETAAIVDCAGVFSGAAVPQGQSYVQMPGDTGLPIFSANPRFAAESVAELGAAYHNLIILAPPSDTHLVELADVFANASLRIFLLQSGRATVARVGRLRHAEGTAGTLPEQRVVVALT